MMMIFLGTTQTYSNSCQPHEHVIL